MASFVGNPMETIIEKINDIKLQVNAIEGKITNRADAEKVDIGEQIKGINSSLKVLADYVSSDSEEVREQKQRDMVRSITNGVNMQLGNVNAAISHFNDSLESRLNNLHFRASLPMDDARLLREINKTLSSTDMESHLSKAKEDMRKTSDSEVKRIADAAAKGREELNGASSNGVRNIRNASYEALNRVREAASWLHHLFEYRIYWITGAISIWVLSIVGCVYWANYSYGKQKAAEQALKSANSIIERMPDYRYWIIYKSKNPNTAAKFQEEMDRRYGSKLFREEINP